MMRLLSILFFALLPASESYVRYDLLFPEEYRAGLEFVSLHRDRIRRTCLKFGNDPRLASAVVFPELMRYSETKDMLETAALELLYIERGPSAADFSIGCFQMKPSFAERLEQMVKADTSLPYRFPPAASSRDERKKRISRLKTLDGQLLYLNCFLSLTGSRVPGWPCSGRRDSVLFFASAYNVGLLEDTREMLRRAETACFPYGLKYPGKQYRYAEVAWYYYEKTYLKNTSKQ